MPTVLIVYHFFHPDDVVSARQFSYLARGLAERGWDISVLTSNRVFRNPKGRISEKKETWHGVKIHRVSRPAFRQSSNIGRLCNSAWLMAKWLFFIARQPAYDAIILGTDPQFGYFILPWIHLLKRRTRLLHWVFDMYPECIIADSPGFLGKLASITKGMAGFCYKFVDGMVDIGPCMRRRLNTYGHKAEQTTITPWALVEPTSPLKSDMDTRKELCGDARLALLYSGTIGNAHEFKLFITLARELRQRKASIHFCFAGRGNRYAALRESVQEQDTNISFAGFANEEQLAKRLGAGDIHLISLREGWDGVVLPSKFFGSLAAGKPLLYTGTKASAIPGWIEEYKVGFVINEQNVLQTADALCELAETPAALEQMQARAYACYQQHFSFKANTNAWDKFLRQIFKGKSCQAR